MWDLGKSDVLGVLVDAVDSDAAVHKVMTAARERRGFAAMPLRIPELVAALGDPARRALLNRLDLVTPATRPLMRALNRLHQAALTRPVSGPRLALLLCRAAADEGLPIFLYGADGPTLERVRAALSRRFPGLVVAGAEPASPSWADPAERTAIARRIRGSGARLVLVGFAPADEARVVVEYRDLLGMPVVATGDALAALAAPATDRGRTPAPGAHLRFAVLVLLQWLRLWRPERHGEPRHVPERATAGAVPAGQPIE